MLKEESIWIKEILEEVEGSLVRDVLDVGSSTLQFRTQTQPYIEENVFRPLRERGLSIFYLDKKENIGVDYVYDVENTNISEIGKEFDLVICCSLLEHVKEPKKICSLLIDLTKRDRFLLVTVPKSYRYHPDPIDTMFRPSIDTLISMFPGMEVVEKKVVYVKGKERYKLSVISELLRYIIPAFNWKVNCLFMRKTK